ncbi:MAG: hypothetical protein HY453_00570 [Parcubacteria group bacterium]|nr:hypothetical protein [Parcubacteria group bacterium]
MISSPSQKGFTLLEFIIYTTLTTLIMGILVIISISTLRSRALSNNDLIVQRNMTVAFETIITKIEKANAITAPTSGTSNTLELTGDDPLKYPSIFTLNAGKLMLSVAGSATEPLTSDDVAVTDFSVTRMSDPIDGAQISLSIETKNPPTPDLYSKENLRTTIMLSY